MREIKFRAWDTRKKRFLYDVSFHFVDNKLLGFQSRNPDVYDSFPEENEYIIQQYTGLKDRNGREIYEGDICRAYKPNSYLEGEYIVAWHEEKGRWYYKNQPSYKDLYQVGSVGNTFCEVIGNIYENPDLVKEK